MAGTPWTAIGVFCVIVSALVALIYWARDTAPSDAETGQLPYNRESKKALESRKSSINGSDDGSIVGKMRYAGI